MAGDCEEGKGARARKGRGICCLLSVVLVAVYRAKRHYSPFARFKPSPLSHPEPTRSPNMKTASFHIFNTAVTNLTAVCEPHANSAPAMTKKKISKNTRRIGRD